MKNNYGEAVDSVGFGEAISICFKKYFVFQGRAKLSEYWYFILFCIILSLIGIYLSSIGSTPLSILGLVLSYGTIIPQISVNVRRLHDTNRSGWYLWIPIYNLIITMFFDSSSEVSTSKSNINKSKRCVQCGEVVPFCFFTTPRNIYTAPPRSPINLGPEQLNNSFPQSEPTINHQMNASKTIQPLIHN